MSAKIFLVKMRHFFRGCFIQRLVGISNKKKTIAGYRQHNVIKVIVIVIVIEKTITIIQAFTPKNFWVLGLGWVYIPKPKKFYTQTQNPYPKPKNCYTQTQNPKIFWVKRHQLPYYRSLSFFVFIGTNNEFKLFIPEHNREEFPLKFENPAALSSFSHRSAWLYRFHRAR